VKKELFDALTSIQERLSSEGVEQCPCAVAEAAGAPRIVKVLARQQGCCCGHGEHAHAPGEPHGAAAPPTDAGRPPGAPAHPRRLP
jgi:hypothetical protein